MKFMYKDSDFLEQQIHLVGLIKTNQFTVCSDIHTKHINSLYGQNVELSDAKPGGT